MARNHNSLGGPELHILDPTVEVSDYEKSIIPEVLEAASRAVANPTQSGYNVLAAVLNANGLLINGGNREYGLSRAYVHGEEATMSKLKSIDPDSDPMAIGFYGEGMSISPCGNCRDVLVAEAPRNMLVVAGNERQAAVARLSTFLYDPIATPEAITAVEEDERALTIALKALARSVTTYLRPSHMEDMAYGVALVDEGGMIFPGSLDTTAGYDATSPLVAAIQSYRNRPEGISPAVNPIKKIVIVRESEEGELPDVLYRDRNAALENDEKLKVHALGSHPAKVVLAGFDWNGNLTNAATTNTLEWLPMPFTNHSLGMDDASEAQYEDLVTYM